MVHVKETSLKMKKKSFLMKVMLIQRGILQLLTDLVISGARISLFRSSGRTFAITCVRKDSTKSKTVRYVSAL